MSTSATVGCALKAQLLRNENAATRTMSAALTSKPVSELIINV